MADLDNNDKEFARIIDSNYSDPVEDYYARQYVQFLKTGKCLLNDTQVEILSHDDIRNRDLADTYGLDFDQAGLVYEYIEEFDMPDLDKEVK